MSDLLERLEHFKVNQENLGDRYGSEVLHNAIEEIKELKARNEKLERVVEAYRVYVETEDGSGREIEEALNQLNEIDK